MTYKEISDLGKILTILGTKKLPRKLTVAIVRNTSIINPIIDTINEQNMDIARKYCKLDDNGNVLISHNENGDATIQFNNAEDGTHYITELNELENVEENINLIKITSDVLDSLDNDKFDTLTANEEIQIACMIDYID